MSDLNQCECKYEKPSTPQEIGLQLIRVGRLNEVSQLLSQPEYTPLRPALLLLGWDVYVTEGSGKELTEALWPSQVTGTTCTCTCTGTTCTCTCTCIFY